MSSSNRAIVRIHAREILDSRGRPTVEAEVHTSSGCIGRASVPSGASTGTHEALELRDKDPSRYQGKGVLKAVRNICEMISPSLEGFDCAEQEKIDRKMIAMDGTENKANLGANAILAVSLASARAASENLRIPLWKHLDQDNVARMPMPMVNMISGGLHAGKNLDFQDFLFQPSKATSYSQALEQIVAIYNNLGALLNKHGHEGTLVGDEGGYGPKLQGEREALDFLLLAMERTNINGTIALDVASSHFFQLGQYHLEGRILSPVKMVGLLEELVANYPIASIEDGCAEDDWIGWQELTRKLGSKIQLVGDDFFVTNPKRLFKGIRENAANAVLVKVNQIGSLTETFEVIRMARKHGFKAVVSARSGETEDDFLADLSVASGCGQIKVGSVARSERLAKYNRLLRIEEEMGSKASYGAI
ncbi:MAG: phosphopyruvate hydratase [Planctomycetota bacterium]|nr:MAG: phosphopyruvate hydratase [Planctomycetota bacterium]